MKKVRISGIDAKSTEDVNISGSKSESNRILILKSLYKNISIKNLSTSDDTKILEKNLNSKDFNLNVGHAGTAMRFLTAYLALQQNKRFILSGSERMHKRPIGNLVEALNDLGFKINYIENEGFPPLEIFGRKNLKNKVKLNSEISSQYISAMMLIAPILDGGLVIQLDGKITSRPYIEMTLSILNNLGFDAKFTHDKIIIKSKNNITANSIYEVESCWSSVSYFFSIVALSRDIELSFLNYKPDTFQGDINVLKYYELFGVKSEFINNKLILKKKKNFIYPEKIIIDLNDNPDLAQTIIVTSFGLNIPTKLTGLSTLKIKETDRLEAMCVELIALGADCTVDNESIEIFKSKNKVNKNHVIKTYNDHRMALAFAPLSVIYPLEIYNPQVVSKSFPEFWNILEKLNFSLENL